MWIDRIEAREDAIRGDIIQIVRIQCTSFDNDGTASFVQIRSDNNKRFRCKDVVKALRVLADKLEHSESYENDG